MKDASIRERHGLSQNDCLLRSGTADGLKEADMWKNIAQNIRTLR